MSAPDIAARAGAAAAPRIAAVDALRGIALFGVLVVNVETAFRVPVFESLLPRAAAASSLDHVVARVVSGGLELKAITLFSLLFGAGLAAQRERLRARAAPGDDQAFARFATRRLGFLLVVGLAHLYLVWNGDILTLYAVVGLAAAPLLGLPLRALLAIAAAFLVVHALPLPWPPPFASVTEMDQHIEAARHVYPYGGFSQVLAFRVVEVGPVSRLLLRTAPRTLGLFFLGAWAWRAGVLRGERQSLVRAVAVIGVVGGGAMTAFDLATNIGAIALGLGYGAVVLTLFDSRRLARALSIFVPIGRMALTSYLTQSIVLGALFYGYGLGLFGRLGEASAAAIGVALFALQVIGSALWLRRHPMGPVERLWRWFAYQR